MTGRSGGARTPNPRFWRPVLYQLSYTPAAPCGARLSCRNSAADARGLFLFPSGIPARQQGHGAAVLGPAGDIVANRDRALLAVAYGADAGGRDAP